MTKSGAVIEDRHPERYSAKDLHREVAPTSDGDASRSTPQHDGFRNRRARERERKFRTGIAFSSPLILGLLAFTFIPVAASLYFSLTDYPIFSPPKFIGAGNFTELVHDSRFWLSVWNTFYFAIFAVPLGMLVGLVLALLLNLKVRGLALYRTMFFLPSIMPLIATCVLWHQLLSPEHGLINEILRSIGLPEKWVPGWIADEHWSKPGLVLMSLWGCGGGMVLYLAALQDVPQELYESAALDGATAWHRLRHITLPMISPTLLFTAVTGIIGAMRYFEQAYVMTHGGPWDSTRFYSINLFDTAFQEYRLGYASAMAWVMFVIVLALTIGLMKLSNRFVHYQS
jgi:multiple sugar transport system permease protein